MYADGAPVTGPVGPYPRGVPVDAYGAAPDDEAARRVRYCEEVQQALSRTGQCRTGGLSVAFDLPTGMGYDFSEPISEGDG
jgi:methylmalonyl-CoA mutase N-terminal domain/subunit